MIKWLLLLLLGSVSAGQIELRGELLYWKPTTGGLNLGTVNEQVILLRPRNEFGFSVAGRYWCNCLFGGVQYTHIDARDRRKVVKSIVPPFDNQVVAERVEAKELVDLDLLEARVGYKLYDAHQLRAIVFGVVEAMSARAREEVDYTGSQAIRAKTRYRGIGPGVGLEGDFFLCQGFGLVARIGTSLLIGERELDYRLGATAKLYPSESVVVPTFNGRLAIAYRCRWITAELGYEVRHFVDAFVRGIYRDQAFGSELRDLTYGGAFFALTVVF